MILDHISVLRRHGADSRLIAGLEYLQQIDVTLPAGRYEIGSDGMHVMMNEYHTVPAQERQFEAHRRYIDLQMMLEGEEAVDWCPLAQLTEVHTAYDANKDYGLWMPRQGAAVDMQRIMLRVGNVAVFYPDDGHRPGLIPEGACAAPIRKAVLKVPV